MFSKNFDAYSAYYDLLYKTKKYDAEADFIDALIKEYQPSAETILDLGCGTGVHSWLFAQKGYLVRGIDQSQTMLASARNRASAHSEVFSPPTFEVGDLTAFSVDAPADVIVSLFDVVSYLTTYDALQTALRNIKASLKVGGLFIFDCWYGPAVYTQKPETRIRKLEDDEVKLTRIASADFVHEQNRVDVTYDIFVENKRDGAIKAFTEVHPMRCYFPDELSAMLLALGFEQLFQMEWFSRKKPSPSTWSVLFGYRRKD